MNKFTQEDLIQYLYKETSIQKTAAINTALETDWKLRESLEQIFSAQKNLEEINLSPREETINNILSHASKKQSQLHSH